MDKPTDLHSRLDTLNGLLDSTLELMKEGDQEAFLERLVHQAAELLQTPDAYLYRLDARRQVLECWVGLGVHELYRGITLFKGQGIEGKVWQWQRILRARDYDTWTGRSMGFPQGVMRGVIAAPVCLAGQVIAVLGVSSQDPEQRFEQEQQDLLEYAVRVAEMALEHGLKVQALNSLPRPILSNQDLPQQLSPKLSDQDLPQQLLHNLTEVVVQCAPEGTLLYVNPAWERLTGMSAEASVGHKLLDFLSEEDRQALLKLARQEVRCGSGYRLEFGLNSSEGGMRWLEGRFRFSRDDRGRVCSVIGMMTDITERRQGEQALRQSEAHKRDLLNSLGEAVVEANTEGIIIYVNRAWENITGFSSDQTLGKPFGSFVYPEDRPIVRKLTEEVARTQAASAEGEYRLLNRQGGSRWIRNTGKWLCNAQGEIVGITGVLRDIQQQKEAQAALLESRKLYQDLIESLDAVVWEAEEGSGNTYISPRFIDVLGYTPEDWAIPGFWGTCIYQEDRQATLAALEENLRTKESYQLEYRFVRSDGKVVWLRDMVRVIREGERVLLRGITVDISEQKQTALEIEQMAMELVESEARYSLATRGTNDGIWDWDLVDKQVYLSSRWRHILGYESELEIIEQMDKEVVFADLIHPDDRERYQQVVQEHLDSASSGFALELRMRQKPGTWRWVMFRGVATFDLQGKPIRMAGSLTDITERGNYYDPLTSLPGRSLLTDRLDRAIRTAQRDEDYHFAVLFLDLDRFKVVNDSLGHLIGDELLIEVARRLEASLRPGDTVARLGGDEFVVLLENLYRGEAMAVAERIREQVSRPYFLRGHETYTAASIGIINSTSSYTNPSDYLRAADTAMYRAKESGSGIQVYDEAMLSRANLRLETESNLRRAVEGREFRLHYQPIVGLDGGRVEGYEALLRWIHPVKGMISPAEFIPVAEETGLIVPIGEWVLEEACRQLRQWRWAGQEQLNISVNITARQVHQANFAEFIEDLLDQYQIEPSCLRLEITESSLVEAAEATIANIERLRQQGVIIYLDDFGTGYSSLSYLRKLPIDTLKIDRSFISGIESSNNRLIVQAIVQMAKALGLGIVCEGIETTEQAQWLRGLECEFGQGFFFSRPLPAEQIELEKEEVLAGEDSQ
jgi:diguanylate cyclase (GGDEF)-like protein/PAS domain S-box-containing protein